MSTMKTRTMATTVRTDVSEFEPDHSPRTRTAPADAVPSGPARRDLVPDAEYEWTTHLNLPGLIVAPNAIKPPTPAPAKPGRFAVDALFETEDGDASVACQLPGGLTVAAGLPTALVDETPGRNELSTTDEYTELAAMQLPGRIAVAQAAPAESRDEPRMRGLCATCIHEKHCDFPRPAGGIWRCEEYA